MKRPAGLIIAAILLILGSLLGLLMSGFMAFAAMLAPTLAKNASTPPQPAWLHAMMYIFAAVGVLIAAWGIATAIGVLRMKSWARYSILVIGGCVAVFSLISVLSTTLMLFLLPIPPTVDPAQAHTVALMMRILTGGLIAFYVACAVTGIWWLFYFNRRAIRTLFAQPHADLQPNPRPMLISVLAVLNCLGAILCLADALLPIPAMFLGFAVHGWAKFVIYLLFAVASGVVGWGLWYLQEWGRRLALGVLAFGAVNSIVYIVRPSLATAYTSEFNRSMGIAASPLSPSYQSAMIAFSMIIGLLFLIAVAFVLIRYRHSFRSSAGLPAL